MNNRGHPTVSAPRKVARALVGRALVGRALAAMVLVGGAAACGPRTPGLNVAGIYSRTVSSGTAQTAVDVHIGAPRAGTYITAQGAVDLTSPGFSIAVQEAGINLTEVLHGSQLYLLLPAPARAANRGKAWAEFSLSTGHGAPSVLAGRALAGSVLMAVDPTPTLELLKLAPTGTARLGLRRSNGVTSTEYRLEYSTAELASPTYKAALRAGLVSLLAQIAHPRPAGLAVYVWLDSRGRLVQLQTSVVLGTEPRSPSPSQAALANQLPTTLSVNIYFGHFGEKVVLVAPAAARTNRLPLSELEGGTL
jgi:hypothetical protein